MSQQRKAVPVADGEGRPRRGNARGSTTDKAVVSLAVHFEQLGLAPYEARVLLALLRMGTSTGAELARVSGVPRTSTYGVLDGLTAKGLALRVPAAGTATWTAPGREEVFERLEVAQEEQLRLHRERAQHAREALDAAWPDAPEPSEPFLQLIHTAADTRRHFERLFSEADSEVLVLSRPPWSWQPGKPKSVILDAVGRGVEVRSIYEAEVLSNPAYEAWRAEFDGYVMSGVQARVVGRVPMKLVVFDRRISLIALNEAGSPESRYPTNLLVDHPGFAEVQARGYYDLWSEGRPYPRPRGLTTVGTRSVKQGSSARRGGGSAGGT